MAELFDPEEVSSIKKVALSVFAGVRRLASSPISTLASAAQSGAKRFEAKEIRESIKPTSFRSFLKRRRAQEVTEFGEFITTSSGRGIKRGIIKKRLQERARKQISFLEKKTPQTRAAETTGLQVLERRKKLIESRKLKKTAEISGAVGKFGIASIAAFALKRGPIAIAALAFGSAVGTENERREKDKETRGQNILAQSGTRVPFSVPVIGGLTASTIATIAFNEAAGIGEALGDIWKRLVNGEGLNSFSRLSLIRQRNRAAVLGEVRGVIDTIQQKANRELRTGQQIFQGWKVQGIGGG